MRTFLISLVLLAGCTDAGDTSIEVPFDLFASDELGTSSTGVCTVSPSTSSTAVYKESGILELNPVLNPNPEYVLALQVENYLETNGVQDSNGDAVVPTNVNDFHMEQATVTYLDIEGNLGSTPPGTVYVSGTVSVGGLQSAAAVTVQAVNPSVAVGWANTLAGNGSNGYLATEDMILEVQLSGRLGSGETVTSGILHFPVQLCFGCGNLQLTNTAAAGATPNFVPSCTLNSSNVTVVSAGHGPCCASQDFVDYCVSCGGTGQPCCPGAAPCTSPTDSCKAASTSTTEICADIPNSGSGVCG